MARRGRALVDLEEYTGELVRSEGTEIRVILIADRDSFDKTCELVKEGKTLIVETSSEKVRSKLLALCNSVSGTFHNISDSAVLVSGRRIDLIFEK